MGRARPVGRRWFLSTVGRGAVGVALLGVAACSDDGSAGEAGGGTTPGGDGGGTGEQSGGTSGGSPGTLAWSRVDLGFVSAYVLVRGNEAAVVDTGVGGSADEIGAVLDEAGPGWAGVRHVVLTHKHPDHAGSISDVLAEATRAKGYVGTADLSEVDASRPLTGLDDGAVVFGLQVVGTPGHTAGHIAVFEPETRLLVAGDALNNEDSLAGSNPQFTEDETAANASVRKLAALRPRTILVGHGDPVRSSTAAQLQQLAASLS